MPLTDADLNRRKHTCADCGSPLWQADKSGPARYPLADYVKHRMRGFFDLLVGDEVHEYKGRGSAQGIAAGVLADVCGKAEEGDNVIRVRLHPLPPTPHHPFVHRQTPDGHGKEIRVCGIVYR